MMMDNDESNPISTFANIWKFHPLFSESANWWNMIQEAQFEK